MKNLKVKMKLILGFLVVSALAAIVGMVGIIGMSQISAADTGMYNSNLIAIAPPIKHWIYSARIFVVRRAVKPQEC